MAPIKQKSEIIKDRPSSISLSSSSTSSISSTSKQNHKLSSITKNNIYKRRGQKFVKDSQTVEKFIKLIKFIINSLSDLRLVQ